MDSPNAKAFQKLVMELEATICVDPSSVRTLSDLTQLCNSYLAEEGFESKYCPYLLKLCLIKQFSTQI